MKTIKLIAIGRANPDGFIFDKDNCLKMVKDINEMAKSDDTRVVVTRQSPMEWGLREDKIVGHVVKSWIQDFAVMIDIEFFSHLSHLDYIPVIRASLAGDGYVDKIVLDDLPLYAPKRSLYKIRENFMIKHVLIQWENHGAIVATTVWNV